MSESKNPIKVKVKTILLTILLIAILIIVGIFVFRNNNGNLNENKNLVKVEDVEKDSKEEKADLNTDFLKFNNNKQNMVYSPLSIKYALSMLKEGASGDTEKQIENVLGDIELTKYENIKDVLSLANGVFIRESYKDKIKEEYTKKLTEEYNAEVKLDEFVTATNVNKWIEEKTFGILKDVLSDGAVKTPNLQMIITNALAIDMEWKYKFDAKDTLGMDFETADGSKVKATMMSRNFKNETKYYKDDELSMIAIGLEDYGSTTLEFIAIKPEKEKLDEFIESINTEELEKLVEEMELTSKNKKGVDVKIPKFKFDYTLPLKEGLQKLGVVDAFNQVMADFSKITGSKELYVSDAIHKADIEFSEEGVKAAAVTIFMMDTAGMVSTMEEKPIKLEFDKPFMYIIRDKMTGEMWFLGTVYEPNLWDNDKAEYQR